MTIVPCNGCRRCCVGDAVRILPHEDASQWLTEPHPTMPGSLMLAHKASDECVYLNETGCSIQNAKPQLCNDMDCRKMALAMTYTEIRKLPGLSLIHIWKRGKELLRDERAET